MSFNLSGDFCPTTYPLFHGAGFLGVLVLDAWVFMSGSFERVAADDASARPTMVAHKLGAETSRAAPGHLLPFEDSGEQPSGRPLYFETCRNVNPHFSARAGIEPTRGNGSTAALCCSPRPPGWWVSGSGAAEFTQLDSQESVAKCEAVSDGRCCLSKLTDIEQRWLGEICSDQPSHFWVSAGATVAGCGLWTA
jgi:hypothetical protein